MRFRRSPEQAGVLIEVGFEKLKERISETQRRGLQVRRAGSEKRIEGVTEGGRSGCRHAEDGVGMVPHGSDDPVVIAADPEVGQQLGHDCSRVFH